MPSRTVLLVAGAIVLGSCENRPLVAPSAGDTPLELTAFSALSSSYNLTATATGPTAIALAWLDNSSDEAGLEIHRSTSGPAGAFGLYAVTPANVASANDVSVPQSTLYCYRVRAFRKVGRKTSYAAFSNTACAKTPALPPSNVNATAASSSTIDISWTDNAATDDQFRIERATSSAGPWEPAATTPSQTSYRDANRTADQQVCYRVIAVNADGDSGPSNVDCTTPPAGPSNLTATASGQTVELSWADNSAVEEGYEVERSDDGVTFRSHARVPASVTRFSDYPPSSNTTYWYRVRARKDGGFSDLSNVASATTPPPPAPPTCPDGPERVCDNGVDDDCDGFADFSDPDCLNGCGNPTEVQCGNYADDDCDGLVDGADPDCPAPECDMGCPPDMVCYPNGYCYYP